MLGFLLLGIAALAAGAMNALAGGGSFLTFPALLFTGLDPRLANITSTIALFPGQVTTAAAGRALVRGAAGLSFPRLLVISLGGGIVGAALLLATPAAIFQRLVPFLILFATVVFAWGSFWHRPLSAVGGSVGPRRAMAIQGAISVYGGYFGGGIGLLMLATLTLAGLSVRYAGATKNALAAAMNASAVLVFLASGTVAWPQAAVVAVCAIAGGQVGAFALKRINEKILRVFVVSVGAILTVAMFLRAG
jgi:uncharacterized membrane protein YfcA